MKNLPVLISIVLSCSLLFASAIAADIPDELIYSEINIEKKERKVVTKDDKDTQLIDYKHTYKKQLSEDVAVVPVVMTGRYSAVLPEPTDSQKNPLKTMVKIRFPKQITKVGQAVDYLLKRSGYRLTPVQLADPAQRILLQLPLPEIHRDLGPMPLYRALSTLAGEPYLLVFDPVHRLIGFDLKESFEQIVSN